MNETDNEHRDMEDILRQVHPPEPSAELKRRVVYAAQEAWHTDAAGVPWRVPAIRLAVSTAAAAALISLANLYGDCAQAPRTAGWSSARYDEPRDLGIPSEAYTPFVQYVVMTDGSAGDDASTLLDYLRAVRETLQERMPDETSDGPELVDPRSHANPVRSSLHS